MKSKEALEAFIPIIELIESLPLNNEDTKSKLTKGLYENIEIIKRDLEVLEQLKTKTHLLFTYRKAIAKEFDKWCEENNAVNCSESMATWFLTIKLKEWLENE